MLRMYSIFKKLINLIINYIVESSNMLTSEIKFVEEKRGRFLIQKITKDYNQLEPREDLINKNTSRNSNATDSANQPEKTRKFIHKIHEVNEKTTMDFSCEILIKPNNDWQRFVTITKMPPKEDFDLKILSQNNNIRNITIANGSHNKQKSSAQEIRNQICFDVDIPCIYSKEVPFMKTESLEMFSDLKLKQKMSENETTIESIYGMPNLYNEVNTRESLTFTQSFLNEQNEHNEHNLHNSNKIQERKTEKEIQNKNSIDTIGINTNHMSNETHVIIMPIPNTENSKSSNVIKTFPLLSPIRSSLNNNIVCGKPYRNALSESDYECECFSFTKNKEECISMEFSPIFKSRLAIRKTSEQTYIKPVKTNIKIVPTERYSIYPTEQIPPMEKIHKMNKPPLKVETKVCFCILGTTR